MQVTTFCCKKCRVAAASCQGALTWAVTDALAHDILSCCPTKPQADSCPRQDINDSFMGPCWSTARGFRVCGRDSHGQPTIYPAPQACFTLKQVLYSVSATLESISLGHKRRHGQQAHGRVASSLQTPVICMTCHPPTACPRPTSPVTEKNGNPLATPFRALKSS